MEDNKLTSLIRPLEAFAEKNPQLYRFRVAMLALLGYAYLLVIVLVLLGIVATALYYAKFSFVAIKLTWIPLVLVGLVLRSLWITIPEPDGQELRREDAPSLFELIGEVSNALSGPQVHRVFVSDEFNASIIQIPQFGMFGWLRNYLVVGLPLLHALSPAEFRAVLAHEFGHLSGKHGHFSGWIYRLRQSWLQILTTVHHERRYASFLFAPFLNWYAPYLSAYSFVLARAQEREADTYSVELAGRDVTARTLTRMMTKKRGLMENFWPSFFLGAKEKPMAPRDPFAQMLTGLDHSVGHAKAQKWFLEALRVETGYEDTHPALADRLALIGFPKESPELNGLIDAVVKADKVKESAASHYLRELPEDFLPRANRLWREWIAKSWSERHEEIKRAGKRLAELEAQAKTRALTIDERWEQATLLNDREDRDAALAVLEPILKDNPDHVGANLAFGASLLEQKKPEGIPYLEKVIQTGPALAAEAAALISGFYLETGDEQMAEVFRVRAQALHATHLELQKQAVTFTINDQFVPHGLDESRVEQLRQQLKRIRGLGSAYLFGKVLQGPEPLLYVLGVTTGYTWNAGINDKHVEVLLEDLSGLTNLPSPITILSLDCEHAYLLDRVSRIAGAEIFMTADAGVTYRH